VGSRWRYRRSSDRAAGAGTTRVGSMIGRFSAGIDQLYQMYQVADLMDFSVLNLLEKELTILVTTTSR
ncbi:hypothetical protein ACFXHK_47555, partial [Embleya sp. NPDC059267]|uniref:hypothetical protein n=1 Tax=Embleya sp. NPDC059267 TaxID=3346798 RepID=UPI003685F628